MGGKGIQNSGQKKALLISAGCLSGVAPSDLKRCGAVISRLQPCKVGTELCWASMASVFSPGHL